MPEGVAGDYALSFRLTTASSQYGPSTVFALRLTNRPPPATATPTLAAAITTDPDRDAGAADYLGDCDGDGTVTVAELIGGVASALGAGTPCGALDRDGDRHATVAELVAAVSAALGGCPPAATPTETPARRSPRSRRRSSRAAPSPPATIAPPPPATWCSPTAQLRRPGQRRPDHVDARPPPASSRRPRASGQTSC
ncbi:MAG: hypothetical protein U0802_17930 [Candidatus Binatia bacterium]